MQLIFGPGKNFFFFSLKNQALGHIKLFYTEFTFSWFCASVVDLWWGGGGDTFCGTVLFGVDISPLWLILPFLYIPDCARYSHW